MIVVADTSPLNYLILIGHDGLLPKLYQRVIVPPEVMEELGHEEAPPPVQSWLKKLPEWLEVKAPRASARGTLLLLDPGERQAIWPKSRGLTWC